MKICSLSINQQSLNKLISKISIIQYIMKLHDNKTDIGSITQTAIFFSTSAYQGPMIKLYECGLDRLTFSGRSLEVTQQLSTLCHVMASMLYQGLVTCKFYLCSIYVEFMLAVVAMCDS